MPLRGEACGGLVAAVLVAGLGSGAVQAGCTPPSWTLQAGAQHSRWQERAENGRRLLREQGTLAAADAQAAIRCDGLLLQAALGWADGRRAYDGESTLGQPLQTHSDVRQLQGQVAALLPLGGSDTAAWHAGLALEQARSWRRIASAGAVQGYPERFDQTRLSAVLQHRRPLGVGLALQARLDLGGGPPGRMRLDLPTADPARLHLGSSRHLQAGLTLLGSTPAAGWQIGLQWRHQRTAAGPAATLWRGPLPVGGAAQPAFRQTDLGLSAGWRW